ncbi:unnamed protein product [Alopecurus aequalis]
MRRWWKNAREVVVGEGAVTVVLAHGYGVSQASWDKIIPSISHVGKVLLFDWDFAAGAIEEGDFKFGRFADDLIALMDEREVRGAVFVGHSMSAMVGCIASARRPNLFAHLVLLCASPRYIDSKEDGYIGGFEEAPINAMLDALESDFQAWVKGFVPNAARCATVVEPIERTFLAMDQTVALGVARMIFLGDQREALDVVPVPCTIIQVRDDFVAPLVVAEYMQRRMAMAGTDTVVEIVESVGHFPQLVASARVAAILDGVLLRLRDKEGHGVHTLVPAAGEVEVDDAAIDVTM